MVYKERIRTLVLVSQSHTTKYQQLSSLSHSPLISLHSRLSVSLSPLTAVLSHTLSPHKIPKMELLLTNYPNWELFPLSDSISHVHPAHLLLVSLYEGSTPNIEIFLDDEAKLSLHGLVQHSIKLTELEKNRKLNDLLSALDFNQVVIFVKSVSRATELNKLLVKCNFPSICIHSGMSQEERLACYKAFKDVTQRILVATDLVGGGIDFDQVNIVINYDMPDSAETYLDRVGRDGRFGTKGLAITFVSSSSDSNVLNQVQERFEVDIKELPEQIDCSTYMSS